MTFRLCRHILFQMATVIALASAVSSCHSSHKVSRDDRYEETRSEAKHSRNAIVREASKWLGTKYKYGGESKNGVDCSGMVMKVYLDAAHIKLPRSSAQQQRYCHQIHRKELDEGDLVFFATGRDKKRVSHVGIYIGDGKMIHASTSRGVIISGLDEKYYARNYHSSGRVNENRQSADKKKLKVKTHPDTDTLQPTRHPESRASLPPRQDKLDRAIEQKVDSIYGNWLD